MRRRDLIWVAALLVIDFDESDRRGKLLAPATGQGRSTTSPSCRVTGMRASFRPEDAANCDVSGQQEGNTLHLWKVQIGGRIAQAEHHLR